MNFHLHAPYLDAAPCAQLSPSLPVAVEAPGSHCLGEASLASNGRMSVSVKYGAQSMIREMNKACSR